jgi:hypothetical protein
MTAPSSYSLLKLIPWLYSCSCNWIQLIRPSFAYKTKKVWWVNYKLTTETSVENTVSRIASACIATCIKQWAAWEDKLLMNQHIISAKEYHQYMHFRASHLNSLGTKNWNRWIFHGCLRILSQFIKLACIIRPWKSEAIDFGHQEICKMHVVVT